MATAGTACDAAPPRNIPWVNTKALRGVKATSEGRVTAVFATLGVVDSDGDVTLPGAFENGAPVRISAYNHTSWAGALPVGKGTISERGNEAILDGQFFMDTQAGRETFTTVRQLGALGEWSYGYDILEAEPGTHDSQRVQFLKRLKVHEVSPVILGAGIDTRTVAAKNAGSRANERLKLVETLARANLMKANEMRDPKALRAEAAELVGRAAFVLRSLDL
jgi:phage head maturation protease